MQGRRGENDDVTALGRWAVGPSVNIPIVFKFYTQHL